MEDSPKQTPNQMNRTSVIKKCLNKKRLSLTLQIDLESQMLAFFDDLFESQSLSVNEIKSRDVFFSKHLLPL